MKIWNWLVTSSADPEKLALTVKGFLGTAGSVVLLLAGLTHIKIGNDQVTTIVDACVQITLTLTTIVSAVVTVAAFIRKIILTITKPPQV